MPRKPPNFRRSDLQRAIRAAREEGLPFDRIEVAKDGGFVIHTSKLVITTQEAAAKQEWERATEEVTVKPPPAKAKPTKTAKGKGAKP